MLHAYIKRDFVFTTVVTILLLTVYYPLIRLN